MSEAGSWAGCKPKMPTPGQPDSVASTRSSRLRKLAEEMESAIHTLREIRVARWAAEYPPGHGDRDATRPRPRERGTARTG